MTYRHFLTALSLALAVRVVTLLPGDSLTITGCTTRLELNGNTVQCIAASPTPTRTASSTRTPSPTRTATATRTATLAPSATQTPTASLVPTSAPTVTPTLTPSATALPSTPTSTQPVTTAVADTPTPVQTTVAFVGLAIVGDSTQDEYAAPENNRPAVNWVEHLAAQGLPVGAWGSWGGSRRTGYEFNWARSGAVSANGLVEQAPGVVALIQSGRVSHVLIQIGINDLNNGLAADLYAGRPIDPGAIASTANNIVETARLINAVAPGRVIVASTQNYLSLDLVPDPENSIFVDPAGRQRVIQAFDDLNTRVHANLPAGVIWFDWNAAMNARLATLRQGDTLWLGGQAVSIRVRGNGPANGFVLDAYMHPETAISGLFAQVYLTEMNDVWGLQLPALTDVEIMHRAQ